jgi:GDP-fucose transporter C1
MSFGPSPASKTQLQFASNKWVLNTTTTPLFFIFAQLLIAVVLFLLSHAFGFLVLPFDFNPQLIRGLAPMVMLNVFSLRWVNADFR